MYAADTVGRATHLTFGRGTAQFEALLAFMAVVSIVLWLIVFATIAVRLYLGHIWYRKRHRTHDPNPISP